VFLLFSLFISFCIHLISILFYFDFIFVCLFIHESMAILSWFIVVVLFPNFTKNMVVRVNCKFSYQSKTGLLFEIKAENNSNN